MSANVASFAVVALLLVASPGADSALILRNTMTSGKFAGYMTVLGVQIGLMMHALFAVAGLSALLHYSEMLFRAFAAAGALYLAWIGWLTMRRCRPGDEIGALGAGDIGARRAFWQGLLCNLLNPKVIILFIALMPTFVNPGDGSGAAQLLILSAVLLLINIPFQASLVTVARGIGNRLRGGSRVAAIARLALGGVLLTFALILFADHVVGRFE